MARNKEEEKLYKLEGEYRSRKRKEKRYSTFTKKGNGYCAHYQSEWHACPFQEDMNSNHDCHYCKCCSSCQSDCAGDI